MCLTIQNIIYSFKRDVVIFQYDKYLIWFCYVFQTKKILDNWILMFEDNFWRNVGTYVLKLHTQPEYQTSPIIQY